MLKTLELTAAETERHSDAFDRLWQGDITSILIHDVYPPQLLAEVVQRLERHEPRFLKTWFPAAFRSTFFGRNLNLMDPGLFPHYFAEAERFHDQLRSLIPPPLDIVGHLSSLFSGLAGGRRFEPAPGPEPNQRYMFTTLRAHEPKGYIPAHFDNEQSLRPSFQHLRSIVEPHMISFVLMLAQGEAGGALEVFDLRLETDGTYLLSDDRVTTKPDHRGLPAVSYRLPAGSLVVLDSGRHLHRVTAVEGARKRWTACSFMARTRFGDSVYCWG